MKTKKIMLFTLSACPIGRSMGTVIREVAAFYPELNFETVFVESQAEEANKYRIKTNPTVVFVDNSDKELYRLEGFHETSIVKDIIDKINENKLETTYETAENIETEEEYTIYLLKERKFEPVEVIYKNRTSIKAPRITAITLLLTSSIEGYSNPFPSGTNLELVQFKDNVGTITVKLGSNADAINMEQMKEALELTLLQFGIKHVVLDCI